MFKATESYALSVPKLQEAAVGKIMTEGLLPGGGSYLEVKIDAIHEGLTRNFTFYTQEGLTAKLKNEQGYPSGLESWVKPANVPIIKDHNATADNQIGRVVKAEWKAGEGKGKGCVQLTAHITEPQSIEKFLRGEYQTGSIGMDVDSAFCSVCEENLKDSPWGGYFHEHQRGKYYKKAEKGSENEGSWIETKEKKGAKLCFSRVGNTWAHEYSVVATPSDGHSKVVAMEVREMSIKSGESESINLMTGDFLFKESTQAQLPTEIPTDVNADGTTDEELDEKGGGGHLSVAELMQQHRDLIEYDVQGFYFELCAYAAALGAGVEQIGVTVKVDDKVRAMSLEEIQALSTYLFENNEDLEAELNAVRECVLSTENAAKLPDTAFALVTTVGEKTLRALPYRDAEGNVNAEQLLVSLSRSTSIPTFPATERNKAVKKLVAAARKAAIAKPATADEQLAAAKEILSGVGGHQLLSDAEVEALKESGGTKRVTELEEQLTEVRSELSQREAESDELLEQVADLTAQVEGSGTKHRATILEAILTLEGVDATERESKLLELKDTSLEDLSTKLAGLSENRVIITAPVERRGLAGDDENTSTEKPQIAAETAVAAMFGSPRAKREIVEANRTKK